MTTIEQHIADFKRVWFDDSPSLSIRTSGSTGTPKTITIQKAQMAASARRTCQTLGIQKGYTTLLCMPMDYIAGRMVCVRAWECGLHLIAVEPSLHPFATLQTAPDFCAMTPTQVYETLLEPREAALLRTVRVLLIGGGAISPALAEALKDFSGVWSTYGMTETLSHIALRPLGTQNNNFEQLTSYYNPFPDVKLRLDARGCLVVTDPTIGIQNLVTNDLAELLPDGRFRILGRADNIIVSGGLKWQAEMLEELLIGMPVPFQITAVPDERLGEAIVLLYLDKQEAEQNYKTTCKSKNYAKKSIQKICLHSLPKHAIPHYFFPVRNLPQTPTGKPDRAALRRLAASLMS